jgi:hypothetical protein
VPKPRKQPVRLSDFQLPVSHDASVVQIDCSPSRFSELTISGSESEMKDWLGPNDLALRFVGGNEGIREAWITTATGEVAIA